MQALSFLWGPSSVGVAYLWRHVGEGRDDRNRQPIEVVLFQARPTCWAVEPTSRGYWSSRSLLAEDRRGPRSPASISRDRRPPLLGWAHVAAGSTVQGRRTVDHGGVFATPRHKGVLPSWTREPVVSQESSMREQSPRPNMMMPSEDPGPQPAGCWGAGFRAWRTSNCSGHPRAVPRPPEPLRQ